MVKTGMFSGKFLLYRNGRLAEKKPFQNKYRVLKDNGDMADVQVVKGALGIGKPYLKVNGEVIRIFPPVQTYEIILYLLPLGMFLFGLVGAIFYVFTFGIIAKTIQTSKNGMSAFLASVFITIVMYVLAIIVAGAIGLAIMGMEYQI